MINWVGNKLKYLNQIKPYADLFKTIVDPMMGSGNVLIELASTHNIMGNDCVKLMPRIYTLIKSFKTDLSDIQRVIEINGGFKELKQYYDFRNYWNGKYLSDNFDDMFLIETYLLLKMCSNSMVRFNSSGVFNQGFRGTTPEGFFSKVNLSKYASELKRLQDTVDPEKHIFYHEDVIDFINGYEFKFDSTLFIFDPPYVLQEGMYHKGTYNIAKEAELTRFIEKNNVKFIFFNFTERNGEFHISFNDFIKRHSFERVELRNKSSAGQGRSGTAEIKECLITNVKNIIGNLDYN